jgi:hypothetical protein
VLETKRLFSKGFASLDCDGLKGFLILQPGMIQARAAPQPINTADQHHYSVCTMDVVQSFRSSLTTASTWEGSSRTSLSECLVTRRILGHALARIKERQQTINNLPMKKHTPPPHPVLFTHTHARALVSSLIFPNLSTLNVSLTLTFISKRSNAYRTIHTSLPFLSNDRVGPVDLTFTLDAFLGKGFEEVLSPSSVPPPKLFPMRFASFATDWFIFSRTAEMQHKEKGQSGP